MKIFYTKKFEREYKKINIEIKKRFEFTEKSFRKNPFDKKLKTHKLSGNLSDFWSYSLDYKNRVIFEIFKEDEIIFHSIGSHDIYK
jgi:addiction module RelE/StbE family toxin